MEELNPSEISQVIKQKIDALNTSAKPSNEGTVRFFSRWNKPEYPGLGESHGTESL
jgi:hypothetical protein